MYIPYQTPYLLSLGLSGQAVGSIVGAYGISQMLLRLPLGMMADMGGTHKRLIVLGGLLAGTASILRVVLNSGAGFFAANLLSGFASAMWISFMVLYMSYFPANAQHTATSSLILCNNLGMLLGFLISFLCYEAVGMQMICVCSVAGGFGAAVLALGLSREEKPVQRAVPQELLRVCAGKRLLFFSLLALIQQGVQMSTTMSFTTQIMKELGASTQQVGLASVVYMVSAVGWSKFSSSALCAKIGARRWIPLVFLTTAAYCLLTPRASAVLTVYLLQTLPGLATGVLYTYLTST